MAALASSDTIQKIKMQTRYNASISTDLAHYLEFREFYAVSEACFLEVFYLDLLGQMLNSC